MSAGCQPAIQPINNRRYLAGRGRHGVGGTRAFSPGYNITGLQPWGLVRLGLDSVWASEEGQVATNSRAKAHENFTSDYYQFAGIHGGGHGSTGGGALY